MSSSVEHGGNGIFAAKSLLLLGRSTGIEPATSGTTNHCAPSILAEMRRFSLGVCPVWHNDAPPRELLELFFEQGSNGIARHGTLCHKERADAVLQTPTGPDPHAMERAMAVLPIPELSENFKARFWAAVDVRSDGECWLWKAKRGGSGGYGCVQLNGSTFFAHRIVMAICGNNPGDACVLHSCDNPPCCNPGHLRLGSHKDNMVEKMAKGRGNHPRGERNHRAKLTDEIVRQIRVAKGTQFQIAAQFGIERTLISRVKNGRRWGHVQ